jgi:SAM-dependent methyltransferase
VTDVEKLRRSFDLIAEEYAAVFFCELDSKPFDRDRLRQFARACTSGGIVVDVGCGPGHVGRFVAGERLIASEGQMAGERRMAAERGIAGEPAETPRVLGVDVSEASVRVARRLNPSLAFVAADMRALPLHDGAGAGLVAFYSVIYWDRETTNAILQEFRRVLRVGGPLLLAVHAGEGSERFTEFHGKRIDVTLWYHQPQRLAADVEAAGFSIDAVETRPPYDFEHPTTRLYVAARAT